MDLTLNVNYCLSYYVELKLKQFPDRRYRS